MSRLDDHMSAAVGDLRSDLDRLSPPPFKPKRSAAPAVLALVLITCFGVAGLLLRSGPDEAGSIGIATQPSEVIDVPGGGSDGEASDESTAKQATPDFNVDASSQHTEGTDATTRPRAVQVGQLTSAQPGEFYLPVSDSAWNADETQLLVYRTGSATPGHVVISVATGEIVTELPFTPPDIEQVYWDPTVARRVLYAQGADLTAYDVATLESTTLHRFENCDRVDSGTLPVAPSTTGLISLLCHQGADVTQVSYQLSSGAEQRVVSASDSAAVPSPSGEYLVRWNEDGSASVLDTQLAETGTRLDLDHNLFAFVTDESGREWAAATLFDGSFVGSVVVLPLDGGDSPTVIVGPDRGDPYPPGGTLISGAGAKLAIAVAGPDDGELAGHITHLDLGESFSNPVRSSTTHGIGANHDYWSKPFLSLSPSGRYVAWSSDQGGDRVNTFITDFGGPPG